jgi:hypothetical protein
METVAANSTEIDYNKIKNVKIQKVPTSGWAKNDIFS